MRSKLTVTYKDPIEQLFGRAGESGKDVLIFVHGGLVRFEDSMARTNLLVARYDEDAPSKLDDFYPGRGGFHAKYLR